MLTMTDIINAKLSLAGSMSESELIKYILNEDAVSAKKKRMFEGARYYATEHDSLNKAYDESVIEEVEEVDGEENTRRRPKDRVYRGQGADAYGQGRGGRRRAQDVRGFCDRDSG